MRSLSQKTKIWWHNAVSRRFGKYSFLDVICKFHLKSLNPFLFTAWSLLKNFTTLREDYAFRTPSIGRRFNFLTRMAVGKFKIFQKIILFISFVLFLFFFRTVSFDEFREIVQETSLHKNIPFPLESSDFVKLYFGKDKSRVITYAEFSQFLHDFHDEYAQVCTFLGIIKVTWKMKPLFLSFLTFQFIKGQKGSKDQ